LNFINKTINKGM